MPVSYAPVNFSREDFNTDAPLAEAIGGAADSFFKGRKAVSDLDTAALQQDSYRLQNELSARQIPLKTAQPAKITFGLKPPPPDVLDSPFASQEPTQPAAGQMPPEAPALPVPAGGGFMSPSPMGQPAMPPLPPPAAGQSRSQSMSTSGPVGVRVPTVQQGSGELDDNTWEMLRNGINDEYGSMGPALMAKAQLSRADLHAIGKGKQHLLSPDALSRLAGIKELDLDAGTDTPAHIMGKQQATFKNQEANRLSREKIANDKLVSTHGLKKAELILKLRNQVFLEGKFAAGQRVLEQFVFDNPQSAAQAADQTMQNIQQVVYNSAEAMPELKGYMDRAKNSTARETDRTLKDAEQELLRLEIERGMEKVAAGNPGMLAYVMGLVGYAQSGGASKPAKPETKKPDERKPIPAGKVKEMQDKGFTDKDIDKWLDGNGYQPRAKGK